MSKVHLTFTLDRHTGFPPPHVAAAIDINANNKADPGENFRLRQKEGELEWTGTLTFAADPAGLYAMVIFAANIGARFEIKMRKDNAKGAVLAEVKGVIERFPEVRFPVLQAGK